MSVSRRPRSRMRSTMACAMSSSCKTRPHAMSGLFARSSNPPGRLMSPHETFSTGRPAADLTEYFHASRASTSRKHGRVARPSTRQHLHVVRRNPRVSRRNTPSLRRGLGDKKAIERIAVVPRQPRARLGHVRSNRHVYQPRRLRCRKPTGWHRQFAFRDLDFEFPRRCRTEVHAETRVANGCPRRRDELRRCMKGPEQRVRIEQDAHLLGCLARGRSATRGTGTGSIADS